jgi:peptidyl-dipeptidase Dcp
MSKPARAADNPLLSTTYLPYKALPFATVKIEHFEPAFIEALRQHKKELHAISANPDAPTFANTIEALEFAGELLSRVSGTFGALASAKGNQQLRDLQQKMQPAFAAHSAELINDKRLFARIKAVYDAKDTLTLDAEQKVLLEKTYRSFANNGANLPLAQQQRLQDINLKLSQLTTAFGNNITMSTMAWSKTITDETELDGVPDRVKQAFAHDAKKRGLPAGSFVITLGQKSAEVLAHAKNRALREEVFKAQNAVAYGGEYDNTGNILEIVKLRHEKAQIMGHNTYADMILQGRMAQTSKTVEDFLARNLTVYKDAAKAEGQKVKDLAAADGITDYKPWDGAYYSRKLQERDYNLDTEELRPYFELNRVLDGLFDHAGKLFNIGFTAADGKYPVYADDMRVFEVYDKKDGGLIGVFYTDYYERPGEKRPGAWMNAFRNAGLDASGTMHVPHVINVCNYAKPAPGAPTLLSLNDVTTLYHEFGHGLHGLLGRGKYPSLTGTNVQWDFVELPSQLQENWVMEKRVLDNFAVHYQTGAKMPKALIDKARAADKFGVAGMGLRQTWLGMLDMAWNNADPATIKNVEELEERIGTLTGTFNKAANFGAMSTRFSHIFSGGYAAGYYSYKWAEVLEADIFETKFKGKLYNRQNADELRSKIYAAGGTRLPMDLFVDYMGRKPDPDALFRREGLLPAKAAPAIPANANKPPPPAPAV